MVRIPIILALSCLMAGCGWSLSNSVKSGASGNSAESFVASSSVVTTPDLDNKLTEPKIDEILSNEREYCILVLFVEDYQVKIIDGNIGIHSSDGRRLISPNDRDGSFAVAEDAFGSEVWKDISSTVTTEPRSFVYFYFQDYSADRVKSMALKWQSQKCVRSVWLLPVGVITNHMSL